MNIREPGHYHFIKQARSRQGKFKRLRKLMAATLILLVIIVLAAASSYARPVPGLTARSLPPSAVARAVPLSWPVDGQGAAGIVGQGVLATSGNMQPRPIASVAKVMTAYAVLQKKPLKDGQQGPVITVTEADVRLYNDYLNQGGSVLPVRLGEQLTEYQLLQAVMLPSANNAADMLAVWAYGSMSDYHAAANKIAGQLGMKQSVFAGDASGFLPDTLSTPEDLVKLGQAFLQNPTLKQIAAQPSADFPEAGTVKNVNWLLGSYGITGIKTGNTDAAGGCYLAAATHLLPDGQQLTIIAAITASPTLGSAMTAGMKLLNSVYAGYGAVTVAKKGDSLAQYYVPWTNTSVTATAAADLTVYAWQGTAPKVKITTKRLELPTAAGAVVGTASSGGKSVNLVINQAVTAPTAGWRVWRGR